MVNSSKPCAIPCERCDTLFCTLLCREIIKLCSIRNKNDIIKLGTVFSLID